MPRVARRCPHGYGVGARVMRLARLEMRDTPRAREAVAVTGAAASSVVGLQVRGHLAAITRGGALPAWSSPGATMPSNEELKLTSACPSFARAPGASAPWRSQLNSSVRPT
jgi:hypothetical protein